MLDVQLSGPELGDFICTEGDCQIGRALVAEMVATYNSLEGTQGASFASKYKSTVAATSTQLDDTDGFWVHWLPFHPGCCTIKAIGAQAQEITRQMRTDAGAAQSSPIDTRGPTDKTSFFDDVTTLIKWTLFAGLVGAVGFGIYQGVKIIKETSK